MKKPFIIGRKSSPLWSLHMNGKRQIVYITVYRKMKKMSKMKICSGRGINNGVFLNKVIRGRLHWEDDIWLEGDEDLSSVDC